MQLLQLLHKLALSKSFLYIYLLNNCNKCNIYIYILFICSSPSPFIYTPMQKLHLLQLFQNDIIGRMFRRAADQLFFDGAGLD